MPDAQVSSPTPDAQPEAQQSELPIGSAEGTANPKEVDSSQAKGESAQETPQAAPAEGKPAKEESFTDVDLNSLDQQNREAYVNMLRDYKQKTQTIADERRQLDAIKEKADAYEQLAQDPAFVEYYNSYRNQGQQQPQSVPEQHEMTDDEWNEIISSPKKHREYLENLMTQKTKTSQQELEKQKSITRRMQADRFVETFKRRPEYANFDKYDSNGLKFITYQVAAQKISPDATEKEWETVLKNAYTQADQAYKKIYDEGYQAGLERLAQKGAETTETPTQGLPPTFTGNTPAKKLSPQEAVDLAKRGIRVPQDW